MLDNYRLLRISFPKIKQILAKYQIIKLPTPTSVKGFPENVHNPPTEFGLKWDSSRVAIFLYYIFPLQDFLSKTLIRFLFGYGLRDGAATVF